MALSLVTFNVLADSYIRPQWYPNTADRWLEPSVRHPALLSQLVSLDADFFALQEVELHVFELLQEGLTPLGYAGSYEPKGRAKPDGCARFVRQSAAVLIDEERLDYSDADLDEPVSGHLALITILEVSGRRLGVANTHLKWAPPGTPHSDHLGARQIDELSALCAAHSCASWVICGDLNCTADSSILDGVRAAGLVDAHSGLASPTCNANGNLRKLDHVFITGDMLADTAPIEPIDESTALPSSCHASDHLPVQVTLRWRYVYSGDGL